MATTRKVNRRERARRLMSRRWCSSMDLIMFIPTTTPSKVLHEVRSMPGVTVQKRQRGDGVFQYRVAV